MKGPLNTRRCSLTLGFREHRWGAWKNPQTGQYQSICCERCGLWWGDFTRKFPSVAFQWARGEASK